MQTKKETNKTREKRNQQKRRRSQQLFALQDKAGNSVFYVLCVTYLLSYLLE